ITITAIIVFAICIVIAYFFASIIESIPVAENLAVNIALLIYLGMILLSINELTHLELKWISRNLQHGLTIGLISSGICFTITLVMDWVSRLFSALSRHLRIRRYPEEEIMQTLCMALAHLDSNSNLSSSIQFRRDLVNYLEIIGRCIEHGLYRILLFRSVD